MERRKFTGPFDLVHLPVAPLLHAFRASRRLPLRAHVWEVDKKVVRQRLGPLGEDAVCGLPGICTQEPQAAAENPHFRSCQRQQSGPSHLDLRQGRPCRLRRY